MREAGLRGDSVDGEVGCAEESLYFPKSHAENFLSGGDRACQDV